MKKIAITMAPVATTALAGCDIYAAAPDSLAVGHLTDEDLKKRIVSGRPDKRIPGGD